MKITIKEIILKNVVLDVNEKELAMFSSKDSTVAKLDTVAKPVAKLDTVVKPVAKLDTVAKLKKEVADSLEKTKIEDILEYAKKMDDGEGGKKRKAVKGLLNDFHAEFISSLSEKDATPFFKKLKEI